MNNPLTFALRGAAGFCLTELILAVAVSFEAEVLRHRGFPPLLGLTVVIVFPLIGGALGAFALFYETSHWVRATVGFGAAILFVLGTLAFAFMGLWNDAEIEHMGAYGGGMRPELFRAGSGLLIDGLRHWPCVARGLCLRFDRFPYGLLVVPRPSPYAPLDPANPEPAHRRRAVRVFRGKGGRPRLSRLSAQGLTRRQERMAKRFTTVPTAPTSCRATPLQCGGSFLGSWFTFPAIAHRLCAKRVAVSFER